MTRFFMMFLILCTPLLAKAETMVYVGDAGQKLTLERATDLSQGSFFVKLDGVESAWAGKVFVVKARKKAGSDDRYVFDWDGVNKQGKTEAGTYEMILPGDDTLVAGTILKTINVYYKGGSDSPLVLTFNKEAQKATKPKELAAEYKASPYKPKP